jgi:hypothetical protein
MHPTGEPRSDEPTSEVTARSGSAPPSRPAAHRN